MKAAACFLAALGVASAFVAPAVPAPAARKAATTPRMALNAELTKTYPRDFKNIPVGTSYGACVCLVAFGVFGYFAAAAGAAWV